MTDSFFGFETSRLSDDDLGLNDPESRLVDDDRFNSETFGADAGEWEEDNHEKIASCMERERSALQALGNGHVHLEATSERLGDGHVHLEATSERLGDGHVHLEATSERLGDGHVHLEATSDIERGLSKLVTDDELDDPCIMTVRRSSRPTPGMAIPRPLQQLTRARSPPMSSMLESEVSGSPSANSIWSTTPTWSASNFEDPAIMSAVVNRQHRAAPAARLPPPPASKVRTVEELEQDLLSRSPARPGPPPPPGFGRTPPAPPLDLSRPPPMRLPPPGESFRLPNTHVPPPSVTSILPPQLMNREHAGQRPPLAAGRPSAAGPQHWRQERDRDRRRQDPYAGLMTQRERQWLLNIQRMQIKGNSDFYFRHFNPHRLSQGRRDSRGGRHDDRQKERDDKHTDHRNYKPPQMENSLGKLQIASVTAPRKIIDLGVINQECVDGTRDHKEAKRDRQTLLLIEQLYHQLMLMENADRRAAGTLSPDSEPEEGGCQPEVNHEEVRAAAAGRLWTGLSHEHQLVHILGIRKGKGLVLRCIPVLNTQQYYQIATILLKHLVPILHKDKLDSMLHKFHVCLQLVISNSDLEQIADLTAALTASTDLDSTTPGKTPLQIIASSSFGVSVMVLLLLRGDQLSQQPSAPAAATARWRDLYAGLVRCLASMPTLAALLEPVPPALLSRHLAEPRLATRLAGQPVGQPVGPQ